ncbi:MAG: hypothetical protein R6U28_03425 [Cyclonatronaceae bacterium]
MNDFTDLFYTVFSVVIFSFLLLQANSLILRNDTVTVDHEFEKTAIALAQSVIEEARTMAFDQEMSPASIPDDFNDPGNFGNTNPREDYTSFDDYHGYTETVPTQLGDYEISVAVTYADTNPPYDAIGGKSTSKRMTVEATSLANGQSASLVFMKSYFLQ